MIAPFIMEIRNKGSLIEFRATGYFVSSLTFSLTDSLLGGNGKKKKKENLPVIRERASFLDSNDSYRSQKRDWKRMKKKCIENKRARIDEMNAEIFYSRDKSR